MAITKATEQRVNFRLAKHLEIAGFTTDDLNRARVLDERVYKAALRLANNDLTMMRNGNGKGSREAFQNAFADQQRAENDMRILSRDYLLFINFTR